MVSITDPIFVTHQHSNADAQYWYSNFLSIHLSICHVLLLYHHCFTWFTLNISSYFL